MNISQINSTNTAFNGAILKTGQWTSEFERVFDANPEVQRLAQGNKNILAHMSQKTIKTSPYSTNTFYKLSFKVQPEKPTVIDKIKSFLGLTPKYNLSRHHHREFNTIDILRNRIDSEEIASELDIHI